MKISQRGIELIKGFEGCVLHAYKCTPSEEYYTIGYGHYGADVKPDQTISKTIAEVMLRDDLIKYETLVNIYSGYNFNQNEYDSLVSFCYNIGSIKQLTKDGTRTKAEIADAMLLYTHDSAGNELDGLVRRRKAEHDLFTEPVTDITDGYTENTTIGELVTDIIAGKFGINETREDNLFELIQSFVNKRLRG